MNGRAYDYNLGRFLSVDPFIQFPANSQSLNPYSYLMNNPMSGTDPTGYTCDAQSDDQCAKETGASDKSSRSSAQRGMTGNWITVYQRSGPDGRVNNGKSPGKDTESRSGSVAIDHSSQLSSIGSPAMAFAGEQSPSIMEETFTTASAISVRGATMTESWGARELIKKLGELAKGGGRLAVGFGKGANVITGIIIPDNLLEGPHPGDYCPEGCYDAGSYEGADIEAIRGATGPVVMNNNLTDKIGKISSETGLSEKEVRDAIHEAKRRIPRGANIQNPDVLVDTDTGEIYPKTPDGEHGDSIGNIYDN